MTSEKQDILRDFFSGNSKDLVVTVLDDAGAAKDLNSAEITYVITDTNYNVIVRKSSADPTEITIASPTTQGIFTVHLLPQDTVQYWGAYYHHANIVDSNGYEATVFTGRILIFRSVAQRHRQNTLPAYIQGA